MTKDKRKKVSRRKFFVLGGVGTVGLLAIGTYVMRNPMRRAMFEMSESMVVPYSGSGTEANLWFEITKANRLVLHQPKVEMGQGTFTSLAQIVADELDMNFGQIIVKAAETSTGIVDGMSTGGSLSVAQLWNSLRGRQKIRGRYYQFKNCRWCDKRGQQNHDLCRSSCRCNRVGTARHT